jgi:hypothetical protein
MIWRGLWDGDWDGQWEGADEPLAPGFITGVATFRLAVTGSIEDGAAVAAPIFGGGDRRKERPHYFYYEPLSQRPAPASGFIRGTARIKISASGTVTHSTAEIYDLDAFRHDEAALMFAAGWR